MRPYLSYLTIPFLLAAVFMLVRAIRKPRAYVYRQREILEAAACCLMAVGYAVSTDRLAWLRILLLLAGTWLMPDVRDIYDGQLKTLFPKRAEPGKRSEMRKRVKPKGSE